MLTTLRNFECSCPNYPLECSNGCEKNRIPRNEMSLHVSKLCPLSMVPCPYKRYGCVDVKRKDLDTHETESVVKHVKMMNTRIGTLNTQVSTLTSHIEDINTAIQQNKGLEWEIKGVAKRFEKNEKLFSDPFYVHNYKFQGLAKFNRDGNNALDIFLRLCVGILDDSLKFPFLGKVTMTLINLRNSNKSVTKYYLTEGVERFNRRTEDEGLSGWGFEFATKDEVLTEFSRSDSIQIKIEIEYLYKPAEFAKIVTS